MTIEEKKIYLKNYQILAREIEQKQFSLSKLIDSRDRITTILSDMPKGNNNKDRMTISDEIIDLQKDLQQKLTEAMRTRTNIQNKINAIEDIDERIVLNYRYIDNLKFEDIAERMSFSTRSVFYLHDKALKNINIL